jgi:uncharacterized protein (TIGR02599 family)
MCNRCRNGFTLIEMLVAMTVLIILLSIIAAVTQGTALAVHRTSGKLSTYAAARSAFDTMNEKLAQATLDTYLDYYDANGKLQITGTTFVPAMYGRVSNLQFIVKQNSNPVAAFNAVGSASSPSYGQEVYFQCPAAYSNTSAYQSTQGLLNACGYYVQYCNDTSFRPSMVGGSRWRYRLIQAIEPTETLQVCQYAIADTTTWTANIANTGPAATPAPNAIPLADNVVAMVIWPRLPTGQDPVGTNLAPSYIYDSQANSAPVLTKGVGVQPATVDQLPPLLQVTMVVIDEASAARIDTKSSTPPPAIENALQGKFINANNYGSDLASVESSLSGSHVGFEVLNTSVVSRESKWSQ